MRNKLLVISSLLLVLLLRTMNYELRTAIAADSSPSATLSADLKVKLEELKKEIASKAAKLKQEVNRKLKDKAYVGTLKSKTDTSLTLASQTGAKIVTVNQDTVFESNLKPKSSQTKSKQKFSLKTLSEEDYLAALGDVDDNGVLTARKVVLIPQPTQNKTYLWGQVISMSDKLITLQTRDLKNMAVAFSQAGVKKGAEAGSIDDLSIRDFVIVTGSLGKTDIFQAEFIYVIPQGGFIKPKKVATPSAKLVSPSPKSKKVN